MDRIPPTPNESSNQVTQEQADEVKAQIETLTKEELAHEFNLEAQRWGHAGINPAMSVRVDQFKLQMELRALLNFVHAAGIVSEEEFEDRVRRDMLTFMIVLRTNHEREMLRQKIMQGVHQPVKPTIIKPGDV